MTDRQFVKVTVEERVAIITIDHAPVNALNNTVLDELAAAVDEVVADSNVKAAIVTGAGQMAFVAGADINEFTKLTTPESAKEFIVKGQSTFNKIENSPKPFIAAINGVALGGGLELALACHMRIAGDRVRLGQTEINLGIIPGWGGTQRLTRIVGPAKASELILTGDNFTAQEAYRLNLVNKVVPGGEVLKTAKDLAKKVASKGAMAIAAAMDSIGKARDAELNAGLAVEANNVVNLVSTEDAKEGITAFLTKRQPVFKDK
ncbi:MAG: enoyl-CoA hydratase-related protein [Chloroflexota bacterium]